MHRRPCLSLIVLLLLPTLSPALPSLGPGPVITGNLILKVQNSDIGARAAANAVRGAIGGRVLAVNRINTNAGPAYRVKVLLKSGRIRVLLVDAKSGALR